MQAAQAGDIVVLAVGWPAMGLDPVDAGPLRLSREIEAL